MPTWKNANPISRNILGDPNFVGAGTSALIHDAPWKKVDAPDTRPKLNL